MKKIRVVISILVTLVLVLGLTLPAAAQVEPPAVEDELPPGGSMTVTKEVTTPEIPPKPDIYFLADTTGSMGPVIAAVSGNATFIMSAISASDPTAQFGVGNYKDFRVPPNPYAFQHQLGITSATAAVAANISAWSASHGYDGSEGQFYALTRIADPSDPEGIGWRSGSSKIVVWFGDAPAHDPVPTAATGLADNITEATVTADLTAAGIRVIAISWASGPFYLNALDDDPRKSAGDYAAYPGYVKGGTSGQASRIATATGGAYLTAATPGDVVDAILAGLATIKTDVWGEVEADDGLTVTLDPEVHYDVPSGTTVTFTETITVANDVEPCNTLTATVTFYANSHPAEGAEIGTQTISIHVIPVPVEIDIKPGSDPNSINLNGNGVVPVGVFGSATFDVNDIDVSTVLFGISGDNTSAVHSGHIEYLNGDSYDDMVLHFREGELGIPLDTADNAILDLFLTGKLNDGRSFEGKDEVRITPNNPDKSRGKGGKGPK